MKRLIFTTILTIFTINITNAQFVSAQYSESKQVDTRINSELRAFQNFENQLDQFSYAMMVEDVWLARKAKQAIIHTMEIQILSTQKKINELSWRGTSYSKRDNSQTRSRNGGIYSKRNGIGSDFELNQLIDQLETKRWIKYNFESTELIHSRRRDIVNKKDHRQLMYRFRDLMRDDLEKNQREKR
tara:strand:+ start:3151 stop:3708 length:558 start_codon:yes stop_codon:yes gene_type:complete